MSKRRTHSTIDHLPADLKDAVNRMIVDRQWPDDFPRRAAFGFKGEGTDMAGDPKYEDVVEYCKFKGHPVSHSAVGRYAMRLRTLARMKQAGVMTREIMKENTGANASETQRAIAEMITAVGIEYISSKDVYTAEEIRDISKAMKDLAAIAITSDKYIRQQIQEKAKAADANITEIARRKQLDPETLKMIREQIYGITK
jgi:hypothetical protein